MSLPISTVAAESGIAKEVLRKWETRYGFPVPIRDAAGNRLYSAEQLDRLKLIKRLMDLGMRPGQLVPLDAARLAELSGGQAGGGDAIPDDPLVACLQKRDPAGLEHHLRVQLSRLGPDAFILDLMPRMNALVGEAWSRGMLAVRDEHLYTETVQRLVRETVSPVAGEDRQPRVLLTTPPGELHTLGILMLEAALSRRQAQCISLGAQSPPDEIVLAAQEYDARIVGLSFSDSFPARKIYPLLKELRSQLPGPVQLWVGGAGASTAQKMPRGVVLLSSIVEAVAELEKFRRGKA